MISVKLNKEERRILEDFKEFIQQSKDSTAIKLGWLYASKVIPHEFGGMIGVRLFKKRSKKTGNPGEI